MALVSLSPGSFMACPFRKPVNTFTVSSLNFMSPVTEIPPRMYSFPFSKVALLLTILSFCDCAFALKLKNSANSTSATENNFL